MSPGVGDRIGIVFTPAGKLAPPLPLATFGFGFVALT